MIKAIEFVAAWLFMFVLTALMTGQVWLWPAASVVLVVVIFYDDRRKLKKRINEGKERQRIAKEKQLAGADRFARDCAVMAHLEESGFCCCELTDEAIATFTNPN